LNEEWNKITRYSERGISVLLRKLRRNTYKIKMKMIENHYNEIVTINERSIHVILESNVRERQKGERSSEHEVRKVHNLDWTN